MPIFEVLSNNMKVQIWPTHFIRLQRKLKSSLECGGGHKLQSSLECVGGYKFQSVLECVGGSISFRVRGLWSISICSR